MSLEGYSQSARGGLDGQNVDAIHEEIRQAILRGDIAPGDELSQVRLARHLGVSRTPLREALRMLIYEGLVEGQPGRQVRVAGFSVQDMEQLYVERVTLEAVAVRITTPRLLPADVAEMERCYEEMVTCARAEDYEAWEVPHRALHGAFVAGAGRRTIALLTRLSEHAERYRRLYTTRAEKAWAVGLTEHRRIIDACAAGDADGAARALAEHLGHTALGVMELVEPDHQPTALRTAIAAASAALGTADREATR